jgi:hypothetical protein
LKESALFQELPDEALAELAARLHDYHLAAGKLLYAAGDRAENLYLLYGGQLACAVPDLEGQPAILDAGAVFGERALLDRSPRQFTVSAAADCHLLYLPRADLAWLLEQFPEIEDKLQHLSAGNELRREMVFEWLRPGEQVHFVARKHGAHLWFRWARAIFVAILALLAFLRAIQGPPESQFTWVAAGGGGLLLAGIMVLWEYLDWRNDYYILTNLRVVWLEQVLLRSSSRKEAPLDGIQSINTHTNLLGRWLGFGDVVVRTYTGTVLMPAVADPHNTKQLIEEHVARHRRQQRAEQDDTIRQSVRASLGHEDEGRPSPAAAAPPSVIESSERWRLFKTRSVDPDGITYHKHWFVLFGSLLAPTFFLVAVIYLLSTLNSGLPRDAANWLLALVGVSVPIGVFIYRLLDWQNDIYRVTDESLVDSEKKPLGSEVTKTASLANVLSLENHKVGLIGLILNFGVVRVNVGDSRLEFMDVHNPALVQQDIFLRMQALKQRLEAGQAEEDRQRMTEWLRVYNEERQRDAG